LSEKVSKDLKLSGLTFSMCQTNISSVNCNATYSSLQKNLGVLLTIYNPTVSRSLITRVKVPTGKVIILDSRGATIKGDVICANTTDATDCDLFFNYNYPGYNYTYIFVLPSLISIQVTPSTLSTNTNYTINSAQSIKVSLWSNL
jgi:hypothetical protein